MTGQLNTNLLNSNSEEIQEELDTLSNRLDGVESATSANTDKINEVGNRVDNLANCVSTDSLNATNVAACNIQGSSATITDINANNITVCNKIKAANIEADNITGTINGNVSANTIDAATANIATANVTEKITVASAEITDVNATNANITNGNISTLCTEGITSTGTIASQNVCVKGDINVDGCIIGPKKITTPVNGSVQSGHITGCDVLGAYVQARCCLRSPEIYGNVVNMTQAYFKNASISNLKVKCSLELADGITLPNTLGDTTLTSVTTNKLTVNGDTELNGAVKAGSITIGDGSITAGEVCIGAKGIVIDKDKNAAFADISSSNITAENIEANTKINASCVEAKDVVAENTFAKNLYPENITIDKNVGDLHYSRQLDTDTVGGVLVDCKSITPVEVTHSLFPKNGYIETETSAVDTTYAKNKALKYSKRGNGLSVSSIVYRPDICHSSYKTAVKFITGCSDPGITGCCGKGFTVENNGDKGLSVSYFYDNCHCPFIDYNFCDTNKNTSTVISSCSLDVTSKNINVKNISTCSVSDDNKVLKVDNCGNVYSGKITSSLIGSDCACYNDCTLRFSCIYQYPSNSCYYCINCETDGSYRRACQEMSCCAVKQCVIYCCCCTDNPYNNEGRCYCTHTDTYTDLTEKRKWCCDWNRNTNEQFQCIIDETETRNLGCPITNCVMFVKCCCNGNDPSKNTCVCYWDYTYNGLGGRYNSTYPDYNPKPSYFCRYADGHPELGWCFSIGNNNLYISNPQDDSKDILRVEDGKIYTKCGEFKSGGYFEDATFSNNCISGTRSIVDDTITTCVSDINDNSYYKKVSSIIVNPNGIVLSNNKSTYPTQCLAFCHKSACMCDWLVPVATYSNGSVTREYNFIDNVMTIKNNSGCVICCYSPTSYVECSNCLNECIYTVCCSGYCDCAYISNISKYAECHYKHCEDSYWDSGLNCNYYECNCLGFQSVEAPTIWVLNSCNNTNIVNDGSETPYCVGYSCSRSCNYKFCFENYCKDICACSCSYEGDCRVCYDCGTVHCDCSSIYERYFNGDCLCGCKYNATTCQYDCFETCSCVSISDSSIYKYLRINNNCVSLKEKVTTNQIANLPITNTLVPLAGKVNGKGFAFFCKGSDGTKFYDGAFAVIDAGSATNVTYLVTTGV